MLKRIVSITVAITLILSAFTVSFAADKFEWTEDMERKCSVLYSLGIINQREANSFEYYSNQGVKPILDVRDLSEYIFRNISKSSFINFVCNMYGDHGFTEAYDEKAILLAEEMGIVHRNQTDLTKTLAYDEAMTMMVRLLGYETHAQAGGGFPHGYIQIGKRLGLDEGVAAKSGEWLQEFDAINLLYNAINCAYVEIIGINEDGFIYGNTSDSTFLEEFRGIYRVDGILQGTGTAALRTGFATEENTVMIDGYVYKTEADYTNLLGMNVETYIKDTHENLDDVLCMVPVRNTEIIIDAEDILTVSENCRKIEYLKGDTEKTLSVSSIASVLYNGQPVDDYAKIDFISAQGNIRLIDNGGSSEYEVVFITDYKTVIVDYVSALNETVRNVFTHDNTNLTLNLKAENGDVIRILSDGQEVALSSLEIGDVLTVAESTLNGNRVITVYRSNQKISGTVSTIFNENSKTVILIDDVEYLLSAGFQKALKDRDAKAKNIEVGKSYTFSLDKDGKIAFAEETTDTIQYGIVMAVGVDRGFTNQYTIKLFSSTGEWKELPVADKIKFADTGTTETADTVMGQVGRSADGTISVIAYRTNSANEVVMIDTPEAYAEGKEDVFNMKTISDSNYRTGSRAFEESYVQYFIKDGAVIWFVDDGALHEEDAYSVGSSSNLVANEAYTLQAYNLDEYGFSDLFTIIRKQKDKERSVAQADLFVIEHVAEAINAEGDSVGMLIGAMGNYESVSYYCEDGIIEDNNLKQGDVISFITNQNSYIEQVKKYRTLTSGDVYENPSSLYSAGAVVQGKVMKNDCASYRLKIDCDTSVRTVRLPADSIVTIYDTEKNKVRRGTIYDIEEGNAILCKCQYNQTKSFVVFQ